MMPIGRAARPHRARLVLRGLAALIAILAVVVGVPAVLIYLGAIPDSMPSAHRVWTTLMAQDDGHLVFGVLAAGVWICWALFTLATVQEFFAGLRNRPAPHLPGLRGVQLPAAALVAAVLMIFAATPVAALLPHADATPPPPPPATQGSAQSQTTVPAAPGTSAPPSVAENRAHPTYAVRRHDTLWNIARDHLGDPLRYREIRSLNPDRVGPNNEIVEHTLLAMPTDATGLTPATTLRAHDDTVQPGDTLSAIAQRELGSAGEYPELFDANAGRAEPDGTHLDDPDLIEPGWTITIPAIGTASPAPPSSQPHSTNAADHHSHRQASHRPETAPAPPSRTAPQRQDNPAQPAPPPATAPSDAGDDNFPTAGPGPAAHAPAARSSAVMYELLGAGGGLLAAGALAALIAHRRRAFRYRRPGRAVAAVPDDLVPLERALLTVSGATLERVTFLDQALRTLLLRSGPDQPLPGVLAACLNDTELVLILTGDAPEAPEPWTVAGPGRWVLARGAQLPLPELAEAGTMAPYPCLVSVGHTAEGQEWLLDLEQVAALSLTGDRERCLDLARYMAAELCHNRWSDHLIVTLCGVGADLVQANPTRLAYTDDLAAAATQLRRQLADQPTGLDVLAGRQGLAAGDGWMPHILLATHDRADDPAVAELLGVLAERPGRAAAALVLADTAGAPQTGWELRIDADGTATIPALDLQFEAHRLPEWLADDLGRAIALERDLDADVPVPTADPVDPWDEYADATGGLRPEHTIDRHQPHTGPESIDGAGEPTMVRESILPLPDETYTSTGATTTNDLAALAPAVSAGVANAVRDADPELDADLIAWHDPARRQPKLTLLGPVQLTAHGRPPVKQVDLATEVIAYIATHRGGVTLEQIATDLWPDKGYTTRAGYPKTQISTARHWLGIDDRTGDLYLPEADRAGNDPYLIRRLLIDADLFRRLRTRAITRGDDGITDLLAALQLVRGIPFDRRRPGRWSWLTPDVEALHTAMIIDVAHLVATHALASNSIEQARQVCEIALSTGASDDIALLDLIAVNYAEGHNSQAEAIVQRILVNNDAEIEEDLPPRTFDVLHKLRRQWAEAS